ncbi:helix-turn-helix domain-containing protein [Staphylococcus gallinarum]|uniref:helix-turn-helix domain-containing protein n=1 Tax=Staphylococcus gallinarum TaxID=1293 RepID=UPI002DBBFFC2|nr:helix-turn-helix domain-containing protein [Staphylococcus gallinarum]MEB6242017.1 helix-turn-helix domain-containing protein [Staphylococcus gallinarum]MEB6295194.1 helix-turn-helix domain-containing protein [Staphylococcus gallinarum]
MNSIGQTLKGRRERLGMTLNELESRTQIKRKTLTLIENNDFASLKNQNYAEGFIIKYAKAVNIDSDQLIEAHKEEIPNADHDLDQVIAAFSGEHKPTYRSKDKEPLQLAVVVSFIVIITAILWVLAVLFL